MDLLAVVRRTIRRYDLLRGGRRVLVALSGGGDSVALFHLLRELAEEGDLALAGAAHFNHQLRTAADEDERFCRELCAGLSVPFRSGRADVRSIARSSGRSLEDAARQLRYAFLHEAASRLDADVVAVGHTRDDQAETFLLRILRGAGTRGLGAIRPRAGIVIRPLIDARRGLVRDYAAERGLVFRDDETNADLAIPRNRIRHELLPYLAREFSPGIVEVLAREAALAREDDDRLEREAIENAGSVVLTDTHVQSSERRIGQSVHRVGSAGGSDEPSGVDRVVELDIDALNALHPAIGSRVARIALSRLGDGRFIGFDQVERFLEFARTGNAGSASSLPGQQAVHRGKRIRLQLERARQGRTSFEFPLSIPGEVVLPAQRWTVSADWAGTSNAAGMDGLTALVKELNGPLVVRSRRPGDRFEPPGLGGRAKKLQDYFVDRKVPRASRDDVPLVVDRDDRIVWIVGHAVAEGFRAATPSSGVILLKARQLGGEV